MVLLVHWVSLTILPTVRHAEGLYSFVCLFLESFKNPSSFSKAPIESWAWFTFTVDLKGIVLCVVTVGSRMGVGDSEYKRSHLSDSPLTPEFLVVMVTLLGHPGPNHQKHQSINYQNVKHSDLSFLFLYCTFNWSSICDRKSMPNLLYFYINNLREDSFRKIVCEFLTWWACLMFV